MPPEEIIPILKNGVEAGCTEALFTFWEYAEESSGVARKTRVQTHRKGSKAIWNILSEYNKRVLVINVPITYPPEAVNGVMVSGYGTPSSDVDFT